MKNYVQKGDTLTLVAPYDVSSGDGLLVGSIFGVANTDAASGADVEASVVGVYDLTALSTDTAAVGVAAYWDNTNKRITTTATDNTKIGVFTEAKAAAATYATVRLNGTF